MRGVLDSNQNFAKVITLLRVVEALTHSIPVMTIDSLYCIFIIQFIESLKVRGLRPKRATTIDIRGWRELLNY